MSASAPNGPKPKRQPLPRAKKGEQKAKLDDIGIESICAMIMDDMSYGDIADELNIPKRTLVDWIDVDSARSAKAKQARVKSAAICDLLALRALKEIDDDATSAAVTRQREIAHHYRWRAKTRNPREYGEKMEITNEVGERTIEQVEAAIARLMSKQDGG